MSDPDDTSPHESRGAEGYGIGRRLDDVAFGMTIDNVINCLGDPTSRYESGLGVGNSSTVLEWDDSLCCWFDTAMNSKLSTILVTDPAFRLRGLNVIGLDVDEAERRLTPLLGKSRRMTSTEINDAIAHRTDKRFADHWGISTLEYEDVTLWCRDSTVDSVMWSAQEQTHTDRFPGWLRRFLRLLAKPTRNERTIATELTDEREPE